MPDQTYTKRMVDCIEAHAIAKRLDEREKGAIAARDKYMEMRNANSGKHDLAKQVVVVSREFANAGNLAEAKGWADLAERLIAEMEDSLNV